MQKKRKEEPSKSNGRTENGSSEKDIEKMFDYLKKRWSKPRMLVDVLYRSRDERMDEVEEWEVVEDYLYRLRDGLNLDIKDSDIMTMADNIVYGRYEMEKGEVFYVTGY